MVWIAWLCLAGPRVWFCAILAGFGAMLFAMEDWGPVEDAPLPAWETAFLWFSLAGAAPLWLGSVLFAHNFNEGRRALIPFLANLLPTLGALWFVVPLGGAEGGEFLLIALYLGLDAALLGTGIVAVLVNVLRGPEGEGRDAIWKWNDISRALIL